MEKVRRELGQELEILRQSSDRKVEEMERANRKQLDQLHEDKKELARLKEVSGLKEVGGSTSSLGRGLGPLFEMVVVVY